MSPYRNNFEIFEKQKNIIIIILFMKKILGLGSLGQMDAVVYLYGIFLVPKMFRLSFYIKKNIFVHA